MSVGSDRLPDGVWVVLPTYNEAANIEPIARAILDALPAATLLVVDDASPDGTGDIADGLAATDPRVRVLHRAGKEGLGPAYRHGFRVALEGGASVVIQMDADASHDPNSLPDLLAPILAGKADLVIGSRYAAGGQVMDWGLRRRVISRGGGLFARTVLNLPVNDLTGGFKAWTRDALALATATDTGPGGFAFQIEMTHRAHRLHARICEIPITFRDRRVGVSKMGGRIVVEALAVVVGLRLRELARGPARSKQVVTARTDNLPPPVSDVQTTRKRGAGA